MELTILMPCLNEAETIEVCVRKAREALRRSGIHGEVLIADNGSIDGSPTLALAAGARVVHIERRGYGAALQGGIAAARGRYVIMGDADDSYDFLNIMPFVESLRGGSHLVMGNRFKGGIKAGAMPILHRYLGNPVLSFIGRLFFKIPTVGDFHCGLRGFNRETIQKLGLSSCGMEFASEMVVKAALADLAISEVPTTLNKDGRGRPPHLRTWRDGWRHLRFLLLHSPQWLFLYPGMLLFLIGLSFELILAVGPIHIGRVTLDIHAMLYGAAASILGFQMMWFAVFATRLGITGRSASREQVWMRLWTVEKGALLGGAMVIGGVVWSAIVTFEWGASGFSSLEPAAVMRFVIPAINLMILGTELIFSSFFMGILGLIDPGPSAYGGNPVQEFVNAN